ncbi:MAG: peptidylprolyl isomerase [Nitrospirae bacterium]|nr:peptidylprolyl isomerase [Nitrospirota bacterium]
MALAGETIKEVKEVQEGKEVEKVKEVKEDKEAARVGDVAIKESELDDALRKYVPPGSMHGSMDASKREGFRKDALNDLVEVELLYNEAKSREITVPRDVIEKVVEENLKRFGSEEKFKEALKKEGATIDSFREKITKYRMVNMLMEKIAKESEYSDEELKGYFENNRAKYKRPEALHVWHILVKVNPGASEDEWLKKKEYAEELLQKIKSGEDFRDVAYKYSEDAYKVKEGDLGIVHRGQLEPEIEEAAFSLKEGEVSGTVRTIHGFHIIKAGEKKPEEQLSLDEVKPKLKNELHGNRFKEKKAALLEKLRQQYPVKIYLK